MDDWRYSAIEDLTFDCDSEENDWSVNEDRFALGKHFHWWEKTVESIWLSKHLTTRSSIAPLAGAMERLLGDAVYSKDDEYLIIEFKASKERSESEIKKFRKSSIEIYSEYLPYVQNIIANERDNLQLIGNEPHILCYGYEKIIKKDNIDYAELDINFCDYWGRDKKVHNAKRKDFIDYVLSLSKVRQAPSSGTLIGGVIAVTQQGTSFLDLNDVIAAVRNKFEPRLVTRSTPSYGGSPT